MNFPIHNTVYQIKNQTYGKSHPYVDNFTHLDVVTNYIYRLHLHC